MDTEDLLIFKAADLSSSIVFTVGKVTMPEGQAMFNAVHRRAMALGLTQTQVSQLPNVQKIHKARWDTARRRVVKMALTFTLALLLLTVSWTLDWPVPRESLAKVWWQINGERATSHYVESQSCVVRASHLVQDLARPPVSCTFCRNVMEVVRVTGIAKDEFLEKYAYSGHPLVVEDGAKNWSSINTFNFDYFKGIYKPGSATLDNVKSQCQFFPYKTEFDNLGEVFEMDEDRAQLRDGSKPWYIGWSNCDSTAGNELRAHYTRPYFLPDDSESSNVDWLFMGSPGYGAHLHVDNVRLPSWQAQITGVKTWTLQPPPECYGQCVSTLTATIHPGEIFVIDTNKWFHSTLNVGDVISITIGSEFD